MASPEDLEFNPFFKALQSKYFAQYDRAQQNCWLVCIPAAASLETCTISKEFVEKHLLEPSSLFRDVYESSSPSKLIWRLTDHELQCISGKEVTYSVRVLAEELAYNKSLKQFKMFITDRPMDPKYKEPEGYQSAVTSNVAPALKDALERKRSYKEHIEFLQTFRNYREGLEELNRQIRLFKQNYLVVEKESLLLDTATKLERMVRQGNMAFLDANKQDSKLQDRRVLDACLLSLEGYLMHHVHSKVYPAIRGVHAKQDRHLHDRCRLLRGRLTPSTVGVSDDYECRYPSTLRHLRDLESLETPLEVLYTIQDAMDCIMEDVKDNFVKRLRIGEPSPLASDDLISVVATILTQVDCKCLLSALYYVEHFHWFSDSDQLSYTLVTFRAAVEFLRGSEGAKWLPHSPPLSTNAQVSPNIGESDRRSESPSQSLSASEDSSSSGGSGNGCGPISSLSQTLRTLQISQAPDLERRHHKPHPQGNPPDTGLGPFLSQLLESDNVVTSSDYYKN